MPALGIQLGFRPPAYIRILFVIQPHALPVIHIP